MRGDETRWGDGISSWTSSTAGKGCSMGSSTCQTATISRCTSSVILLVRNQLMGRDPTMLNYCRN